jgi:hypothetical protein
MFCLFDVQFKTHEGSFLKEFIGNLEKKTLFTVKTRFLMCLKSSLHLVVVNKFNLLCMHQKEKKKIVCLAGDKYLMHTEFQPVAESQSTREKNANEWKNVENREQSKT